MLSLLFFSFSLPSFFLSFALYHAPAIPSDPGDVSSIDVEASEVLPSFFLELPHQADVDVVVVIGTVIGVVVDVGLLARGKACRLAWQPRRELFGQPEAMATRSDIRERMASSFYKDVGCELSSKRKKG